MNKIKCECGCKENVTKGRRFISGHNSRGKKSHMKDKSWEEIYGKIRARRMRKNLSNKTRENNPAKKLGVGKKISEAKRGHIVTMETRKNMSSSHKGKIPYNKGKTYEEMYGKEKAENIRNKKRGKNSSSKRPEVREKIRTARQKQILENGGGPNLGTNEKYILDELEKMHNYKILRQYPVCGYFVDGYIKELNLCIEVDEFFHEKQKYKDKEREINIKKELNCKFLRIKENDRQILV